jgi:Flp pilus assembly protein TadG
MRARSAARKAAAAVELALVLPLIGLIVVGMVEIGRALLAREALSNSAQRGCAVAAQAGMSNADVTAAVTDVMAANNLSGFTVQIQVNDVDADVSLARRPDKVSVRVTVPSSRVFWFTTFFITATTFRSESVVMMRQS